MSDFASTFVSPGREPILSYAVTAKSGDTCTAWINGQTTTIKVARDLTVAANDLLLVIRTGLYWVATQRLGTAAVTPPIDNGGAPNQPPSATTGTTVFGPVETRSYRNGAWRTDNDDIYQGQYGGAGNHTGCAFYGSGPRSLAGATVQSAVIQVRRKRGGGITAPQATTMRLVTQATRPGGAPTLGASTSGPTLGWGGTASFTIPTSWAQAMVDGTAGALGFFVGGGSPYVIFDGRGAYGPSFSVTIKWQR